VSDCTLLHCLIKRLIVAWCYTSNDAVFQIPTVTHVLNLQYYPDMHSYTNSKYFFFWQRNTKQ